LVSDNIIFILDRKNKAIYCIEKEEILKQNNQKSISILSPGELNGYCIDKTLEIFEKKYPDVKVKRTALGDSYYTTLSTKLMSGDKDPDILLLHNLKINDFARNKCLLDLNAYPEIKDKFSKMFTGIEQLCTSYGSLTGVPYLLDIMAWAVNEDLLKRLNIELPGDSWTWNDFYEYAKKVRKDINGDGIKDTYIIEAEVRVPYFLDLYESIHIDAINAQVNIDRQELKDLLIIWKKLWDEDLLKPGRMKGHEEDDVLLYHIDMSLALGDATIIYPPHLEHERKYYAQFYALCINNNSENKELAVEFLSTYLSEEVQKHNPVDAIYKDRSIYENSQYFIDAAKFSGDSPFGKMSNDRNYEIYKTMLENSCANYGIPTDLRIFTINTIEKYIRNEIDADEAVSLIEQKAKMIIGE